MSRKARQALVTVLGIVSTVCPAAAQGLEAVGSRAAAMAAFVAVADDASAVVWNPSGLVSGPFFNIQIDLGRSTDKPDEAPGPGVAAARHRSVMVALGTTPFGLAYYRLAHASFVGANPAVVGSVGRQNGQVRVRTLVTNHIGATVQQSVGEYLTLGATVKLVRGSVTAGTIEAGSWDRAFADAESLERRGAATRGDVDAGVMFAAGRMRAGLVVRNLTTPQFGDEAMPGGRMTLERHARAGVAWADRWPGISATVLSVDADLTRVPHSTGERRDVAAGLERWLAGQRVGLRGGVRASTIGDARPVVSVGGSIAVRAGVYVDGYVARGTGVEQAWGVAARLTY